MGTQKNRLNEHPKHMFKLMDKEITTILRWKTLLYWTYGWLVQISIFKGLIQFQIFSGFDRVE